MNAIYISKDGKLLAMNKPEKPILTPSMKADEFLELREDYEQNLKFAIALAEKEQVEFKDKSGTLRLVAKTCKLCFGQGEFNVSATTKKLCTCWHGFDVSGGQVIDLPSGWEIRVEEELCQYVGDAWNQGYSRKVALLLRVEEKKEPKSLTIEDDLAIEVIARFTGNSRGTPIAKQGFIDGALWMKKRLTSTTNKG